MTDDMDLAKEWAVCKPNEENGWVHKYELDCEGLEILDFQERIDYVMACRTNEA